MTQIPGHTLESNYVIAIGASTGGIEALSHIVKDLPASMPAILIVQHIPESFSRSLAERLNQPSQLDCREAQDGEMIKPGNVRVAPGNRHMEVAGYPGHLKIKLSDGERVNGHRPSIDVLFSSMAKHLKDKGVGVILTGMGSDGAQGLLDMSHNGAITLAQDESSSIVYGMPKVAAQIGAAGKILPLHHIAAELIRFSSSIKRLKAASDN